MKMNFGKVILVLAICGVMNLTYGQFAAAEKSSSPFKGKGKAQIVNIVPGPDGVFMTANATGNATHLGKFSRVENILLAPDGSFTGDVTFTAANGDLLIGNIAGAFTSAATASGTYTFTGGTGRFANSTGLAYFSVELTDPVHFNVEFSGSINK